MTRIIDTGSIIIEQAAPWVQWVMLVPVAVVMPLLIVWG